MKHLFIIAALLLAGCGAESNLDDLAEVVVQFPAGATNIRDAGNGWATFEYDGVRLLVSPTGGVAVVGEEVGFLPPGEWEPDMPGDKLPAPGVLD